MSKEKKVKKTYKIQKVVRKPHKVTQSGLASTSSTERTLQLNEETRKRSARIERVFDQMGIKSIKDKAIASDIPLGTMGRISRSDTCPTLEACWKISASSFANKDNRHLVYPSYTLGNKNAPHPQKLKEEHVSMIDLLKDMFATYQDSMTNKITGLIERNNSGEERDQKEFLNILLQLDLFKMRDLQARIAYPSDPHSGFSDIIVGYIEVKDNSEIENLNGKKCIIIPKEGATPLLREVNIINNHILCTSLSGAREGTFILNLEDKIHSIGEAQMIIMDRHINLMKNMASYEAAADSDGGSTDADEDILVIR